MSAAMPPFDEVLERFWATSSGGDPPVTRDAISDAERRLGVRLPPDYLALMRVRDGGSVSGDLDGFPLDPPRTYGSGQVSDYIRISELDGLGELQRSDDFEPEYVPPGLVLLGTPDGHEYLALDYRESGPDGEPPVLWVDTELIFEQRLAPSFRAFLEGLRPSASFPSAIAFQEWLDARPRPRPWPARVLRRLRGRS